MAREYYRNGTDNFIKVCETIIPSINSRGLGTRGKAGDYSFSHYTLPVLELNIVLIISLNILSSHIFKRIGLSKLVSQLTVGLAIGQIAQYLESRNMIDYYYLPIHAEQAIGTLGDLGYMLTLFTMAVKMDMKMIKTTGKKSIAIGSAVFLAPLIANVMFASIFGSTHLVNDQHDLNGLLNVAVIMAMCTFPVVASLLGELKIINSELGRLANSSAILSEALSLTVLTITMVFAGTRVDDITAGWGNKYANTASLVLFLLGVALIIRPAMFWVIRQTPEGRPVKDHYLMIIIIVVLLASILSDKFGQFVLFAPYIIGLATPDGPPLGSALVNKLESLLSGFFLPIFVTVCSAKVTFKGFDAAADFEPAVWGVIFLSIITLVIKVAASLMITVFGCNMPFTDGLTLSLIMSSKGVVELASYSFMRDTATISDPMYAALVIMTMLKAGMIPFFIQKIYDPSRKYAGYQKRNIMHLRLKDEFRILMCIHRPDNVGSAIKLLDVSGPTPQSPIAVFVLHIIELVGRTTPVFISHQFQTKTVSDHSYSENVILAFDQFEERKDNYAVSVQTYTAISPPKLMHEDICTLALNKLTSLIIMPFHRKWGLDGTIESENPNLRALNCNVLDLAPCSVGILIDRSSLIARSTSLRNSSSLAKPRVGMIFIGGHDDWEAFVYAKRMAMGPEISELSVIRYVAMDDEEESRNKEWNWMVDAEVLKEVKMNNANGVPDNNILYREEIVTDGPEMALRIREMVDEFELLIVGRRYKVECPQTSGLEEWSEFPELGVVGDLLASPDLDSRTSVLVVQQQRMAKSK